MDEYFTSLSTLPQHNDRSEESQEYKSELCRIYPIIYKNLIKNLHMYKKCKFSTIFPEYILILSKIIVYDIILSDTCDWIDYVLMLYEDYYFHP